MMKEGGFAMNSNRLDQLKQEYMSTPIPRELDFVVRRALQKNRQKNHFNKVRIAAASVAAALALVTVGVNSSPVFAQTLAEVAAGGKHSESAHFSSVHS
jgi:hypothetical protein